MSERGASTVHCMRTNRFSLPGALLLEDRLVIIPKLRKLINHLCHLVLVVLPEVVLHPFALLLDL